MFSGVFPGLYIAAQAIVEYIPVLLSVSLGTEFLCLLSTDSREQFSSAASYHHPSSPIHPPSSRLPRGLSCSR
ncbi:hypothetical protein P692DRAFT_20902809, partial [Suillus brevipes Sb2]